MRKARSIAGFSNLLLYLDRIARALEGIRNELQWQRERGAD